MTVEHSETLAGGAWLAEAVAYSCVDTAVGGPHKRNNVRCLEDFRVSEGTVDAYVSYFRFTSGLVKYAAANGKNGTASVRGYPGPAWTPSLVFDFDSSKDLRQAQHDANALVDRLVAYGIPVEGFRVYFSGMKGFMLEVDAGWFGGFAPSVDIADRIKRLAATLTTGLETADLVIYEKMRLLRVPNSRHGKSGLHKIPLTVHELKTSAIEDIHSLAERSRNLSQSTLQPNVIVTLQRMWQATACDPGTSNGDLGTDRAPGIDPARVLAGVAEGQRDATLFRYACRLRAEHRPREEAEVLVVAAARNCYPPLPEGEARRKVEQAYKYPPGHQDHDEYVATSDGIFWLKPAGRTTELVLLCNFSARIVEDVIEDDGVEERRHYVIETRVRGQVQLVTIPATLFAGMSWVPEHLGAGAVIAPGFGLKERLRYAIHVLSGNPAVRRVYAHSGWRLIDGRRVYLHAGGGIGPDGAIRDVTVTLSPPLARLRLPAPLPAGDGTEAVKAALALFDLLPTEIAVPLLGATWVAPLRDLLADDAPDFVLWIHGPSGAFKSEVAAVAQGFYGDFTRQSLPASFSDTANAVERFRFEAKDALLVVDDFHPTGDRKEQAAMDHVARRLLRGAGNVSGRNRMRADTTLRPALPPRSLAIANGERLPQGYSDRARMFPVAVSRGAIDPDRLTEAQSARQRYPQAMATYLRYLAQPSTELEQRLPARFRMLRAEVQGAGGHRREPGQLAHLLLGLETFLDFAVEIEAIAVERREQHLVAARQMLLAQAREHAEAQAEEAPEQLFLRYLRDGFAGKRAYLEDKGGGAPVDAAMWGWERSIERSSFGTEHERWQHPSTAQLVGALDGDWLLLYPEQVYQFVVGAARAAGSTFPVDQNSLVRRLDEAKLIATEIEAGTRRRRVNVWIGCATKRVVKLHRDAVVPFVAANGE